MSRIRFYYYRLSLYYHNINKMIARCDFCLKMLKNDILVKTVGNYVLIQIPFLAYTILIS